MKQLIRRSLRPNLRVLIVSSLCFVVLSMAIFGPSSTNAIQFDPTATEVLRTWDQPVTLAPVLSLTVNTLGDAAEAAAGNGLCDTDQATAGDQCTLRAAIQEANAVAGDDTINFSVTGTINLATALPDITSNMSINGPGSGTLTVQRSTADGIPNFRIFTITGSPLVAILGMTVTNGRTVNGTGSVQGGNGGGIINNGTLTLTDVSVAGNETGVGGGTGGSGGHGGGIFNSGTLTVTDVSVSGKAGDGGSTGGSGGDGGGIYNSGTATLTDVSVTGSRAGDSGETSGPFGSSSTGGSGGNGGGIFNTGNLTLTDVSVSGRTGAGGGPGSMVGGPGGDGGGIYSTGPLMMTNITVSNSSAGNGGLLLPPGGEVRAVVYIPWVAR